MRTLRFACTSTKFIAAPKSIKISFQSARRMSTFQYPTPRRDKSVVDDYHGVKVEDPYRWLEDPDSKETQEWIAEENKITEHYLAQCNARTEIAEALKKMCDYPKYGCPFKRGSNYFYYHNSGLQNQSVLYVQASLKDDPQVFLDPNSWTADGTASIGVSAFSHAGEYFAYGVSKSGSDWQSIHIKTVSNKTDFPEILEWAKFTSLAWTHDGKGFYYTRFPALDIKHKETLGTESTKSENQKIYYHKLGQPQSEDILVYEDTSNPTWLFGVEVSDDGKYLLITTSESCDPLNKLYYADISTGNNGFDAPLQIVKLIDDFKAEYSYITNDGDRFYFKTNLNAPRYRIISIDLQNPAQDLWVETLQETDNVLQDVLCVNDNYLVVVHLEHAQEKPQLLRINEKYVAEKYKDIELPAPGSLSGVTGKKNQKEFFYGFTSFTYPGTIFHYDFDTNQGKIFREILVANFDSSKYNTRQIFYNSGNVRIPMFIIHKKGIPLDGSNLTYLYGYGGFNISLTPYFSAFRCAFLEGFNGVLAIANIRGGGEYGEEWHKAGTLSNKQNVFDDFIAAGEYLIANGFASKSKLSISGGSNGGLLTAACAIQRPDLFGAVITSVGVLDMLRFHKFTIGHFWCSDYGCSDDKDQFQYLYKYSPLHNIKPGNEQFPAILLTTADHDDRVVPLHSFKFAAELQHAYRSKEFQKNPLLIRIETKAGHGGGKPITKMIEETVDIYAFLSLATNTPWKTNHQ